MRVLFAGGGTGGHVYPAIALADALRGRAGILFTGTAGRFESTIVPQAGYALETIASRPLERSLSVGSLRTIGANALGLAQAARVVRAFDPDVVVATGGYVCFPVVAAAWILRRLRLARCSLALLEPNAQPGLTNRLLAPLVDEIWGAFPAQNAAFGVKFVRTGIPVRASLFHPNNRIEAARRLGLDPNRRTIVAVGGSQGARSINNAVCALTTRRTLPETWQVLHISGERDYASIAAEESLPSGGNRVALVPYLADMADAYAVADLVVARAGASTLGELAALGVPAILVPYPFASEQHQLRNAQAFAGAGAGILIEDRDLNADTLWWTLREALEPSRLERLREGARSLAGADAASTIVARIDALASRRTAA